MPVIYLPCIIDIEASGFGSNSYPIEIGVVNSVEDKYCTLIKPFEEWTHWDYLAEQQHGISRTTIEQKGQDVRVVCEQLNAFLDGQTVYSDAWGHDIRWLKTLYEAAGMDLGFTISPIEMISTELQLSLWDATKLYLQQELGLERHRASNDAFLIQQTYARSQIQARDISAGNKLAAT